MGFGRKEWIESELLRLEARSEPLPEVKEAPWEYGFHGSVQSAMADRTGIWNLVSSWIAHQYSRIHLSREGGYNGL